MSSSLLDHARELVERPGAGPAGVWPRAAAFLARQALEEALARLWSANLPGMEKAGYRSQLACLSFASPDRELAQQVRAAWHALSRACHHHAYELAPTAPELEGWFGQVERLVTALERRPG